MTSPSSLDSVNLSQILDGPARDDADRPALILSNGERCSYGRLRAETLRWAGTLRSHGVGRDRVVLADWGGMRGTAVTLGAARVGAAAAHVNPLLTADELTGIATASGFGGVAVAADDPNAVRVALGPHAVVLAQARDEPVDDEPIGCGDDEALVLFTSGTTGLPKPVSMSHGMLIRRLAAYRPAFDGSRPPSVAIMCVPSFHVGGILGLLLSLYSGDTTVVQPRFDAGEWLQLVERHRVQSAFLVPAMLARVLDHPARGDADLGSLRRIAYGAAAAPVALVARAMEVWPEVELSNVFGQTETLGAYAALGPGDHRDPSKIGSVGRPLPGVEVKIVDPDTGDELERGELGELWVRSEQNTESEDGWLHTGDLVTQDAEGYLHPRGRRNDVINRGGEKVVPAEVADALRRHPAIDDAIVAGVPDDELGRRIGAAVIVNDGHDRPTTDDLRSFCRRTLAPFKLPEVVAFVDHLPSNELGKLPQAVAMQFIVANAEGGETP